MEIDEYRKYREKFKDSPLKCFLLAVYSFLDSDVIPFDVKLCVLGLITRRSGDWGVPQIVTILRKELGIEKEKKK